MFPVLGKLGGVGWFVGTPEAIPSFCFLVQYPYLADQYARSSGRV
jgi:hypothetical protein